MDIQSIINKVLGIRKVNAGTLPVAKTNIQKVANQIAVLEGYKKTGTLADRQNNPGNLRYVGQQNSIRGDRGFAKFKTSQDGFGALQNQIKLDASRNLTLKQFIYKYAPPSSNNSALYLKNISNALGVKPNDKLSKIIK